MSATPMPREALPTDVLLFHRICAWCAADLGQLTEPTPGHSFGICSACAHEHFAPLYSEHTGPAPAAPPHGGRSARDCLARRFV